MINYRVELYMGEVTFQIEKNRYIYITVQNIELPCSFSNVGPISQAVLTVNVLSLIIFINYLLVISFTKNWVWLCGIPTQT